MDNDRFRQEMDGDFLDLIRKFDTIDLSKDSNKEAVFSKTLKNINKSKGVKIMKRIEDLKKAGFAVAVIVLVTMVGMQTTFAQEFVEKIIAQISLGHVKYIQYEENSLKERDVPAFMKGKIFDKEGKPIEKFTDEIKEIYTEDGEEIAYIDSDDGSITTSKQAEELRKDGVLVVKDSEGLSNYTCFNVILPAYLPEGYIFDRAEFYKDEEGLVKDTKYISLYFTHLKTGKAIYMQQRFADSETAYEAGTNSELEKIKINGVEGILDNNTSLTWEIYGNIYFLSGAQADREVDKEELIKIAESIK